MRNKPKVLYHASSNNNILEFEPRNESVRHPDEGPVVFATPLASYASCFIVIVDDSWVLINSWGDVDQSYHIVISDEVRFRNSDKGGAIYTLPSDSFYCDDNFGTGESEWVSKVPVKPIDKKVYTSGLNAMLELGVNIYFVTEDIFRECLEADDYGYEILKSLPRFLG